MNKGAKHLALAGTAGLASYVFVLRPWHLKWGATRSEVTGPQPGDGIVERPRIEATRAITIRAPTAEVWPWLVQIGQGRGGFYSYDWLENLMGLEIHSADRILPELQDLEIGDILPNGPETPDEGVVVADLEPERALILHGTLVPGQTMKDYPIHYDETTPRWMDWTWGFILDPLGEDTTRLIARFRMDYRGLQSAMMLHLLLEPSHFVMERKMLLGIKERAEGAS
ncbi:MAG: hypothetical protein GY719_40330 [bacterium]|nr:hypothetical protein [bacterium]